MAATKFLMADRFAVIESHVQVRKHDVFFFLGPGKAEYEELLHYLERAPSTLRAYTTFHQLLHDAGPTSGTHLFVLAAAADFNVNADDKARDEDTNLHYLNLTPSMADHFRVAGTISAIGRLGDVSDGIFRQFPGVLSQKLLDTNDGVPSLRSDSPLPGFVARRDSLASVSTAFLPQGSILSDHLYALTLLRGGNYTRALEFMLARAEGGDKGGMVAVLGRTDGPLGNQTEIARDQESAGMRLGASGVLGFVCARLAVNTGRLSSTAKFTKNLRTRRLEVQHSFVLDPHVAPTLDKIVFRTAASIASHGDYVTASPISRNKLSFTAWAGRLAASGNLYTRKRPYGTKQPDTANSEIWHYIVSQVVEPTEEVLKRSRRAEEEQGRQEKRVRT